jgi:hypothetical protein
MKFFHLAANSNKRNNFIESLMVNDTISIDHSKIRECIVQFYSSLYIEQCNWRTKLDDLSFDSVRGGLG